MYYLVVPDFELYIDGLILHIHCDLLFPRKMTFERLIYSFVLFCNLFIFTAIYFSFSWIQHTFKKIHYCWWWAFLLLLVFAIKNCVDVANSVQVPWSNCKIPQGIYPKAKLLGLTCAYLQLFSMMPNCYLQWFHQITLPSRIGWEEWLPHYPASLDCQTLIFANLAYVKGYLIVV